jgi:UPF0716 protein FxsA
LRGPLIALLFLSFPLVEIAGFVLVGRQIGVLATIGLVIATSIAGSLLLRFQGFGVLSRINKEMQTGQDPSRELAHGVMILVAGLLLLLPGFATDIVGLLLFIPPVRDLGWRLIRSRVNFSGSFTVFRGGVARGGPKRAGNTIDLDADEYTASRPRQEPRPRIDDDR